MTEQDCAQIEELISAHMDGATTPEEDARIERHLGDCADCRATALAFARVDHEVSDYLRATPVPAIGTPWREERRAPVAIPGRFARWRSATIALTTTLVLVVASILAFGAFRGNTQPSVQTSAPQSAYTSGGAAPSTAASTAPRVAASAAPTAAASAAPAAAPAMPPASGARATATSNAPAPASGGVAGSFGTPAASAAASSAPSRAAAGSPPTLNPVQALRLDTATSVAVCQPDCTSSPQGADTFKRIVAILNTALPVANAPTPQGDAKTVLLRFTLADGTQVELQYLPSMPGGDLTPGRLKLPDDRSTIAPAALGEVLASPKSMP